MGGKYRLRELLALGGMGLVYGARNEATGRAVAVKLMRPELAVRPDFVRRVSAEARLAVEASHPNVVEVLDAGTDTFDVPYLVLERLYGQPLEALLHEPLPVLAAAQALMPVLNALSALHRLGIVHRDLKPSNIFLSRSPEGRVTPKLLDFGIAKALEGAGTTLSCTAVGTPAYMAPEQALGCPSGPFTDVWSIGVVFVRCLTGRLPFEGMANPGTVSLRFGLRAPGLQGVPEPVARVLARALRLEPGERPASMAEFRNDLIAALREADPEPSWPNETTVSYAPHESVLASALAQAVNEPADRVEAEEPGASWARVRARRVQTRTLSKWGATGTAASSRVRRWALPLLLLLAVAGVAASFAPWPRREAVSAVAASTPMRVEAPRAADAAPSPVDSSRAPAAITSNPPAPAASAPSPVRDSTPVQVAARDRRQRPAPLREAASGTEPRETEALPAREVPEPTAAASEPRPRLGANRAPIIEWNAQN